MVHFHLKLTRAQGVPWGGVGEVVVGSVEGLKVKAGAEKESQIMLH